MVCGSAAKFDVKSCAEDCSTLLTTRAGDAVDRKRHFQAPCVQETGYSYEDSGRNTYLNTCRTHEITTLLHVESSFKQVDGFEFYRYMSIVISVSFIASEI